MKTSFKKACVPWLAVVLTLAPADASFGQEPAQPAAPLLWQIDPLGQRATLGSPCAPHEDDNGALLIGDPLLDSPPAAPGLVAGLEAGIVFPHILNKLSADVTRTSGATDKVGLPAGPLGVNALPKVELGYRWGQASGEAILSWRSLSADATQAFSTTALSAFTPSGADLRTRLNFQVWDLDYASHEPITVCGVDMKWRAGLRGILYYADSQAANALLFQHVVDRYWGLGPHVLVDFRRSLWRSGLDLFGRLDAALPFGRLNQHFTETVTAAGTTDSGQTNLFNNVQVLTAGFQAGVSWTPPRQACFHVTAAYGYEFIEAVGTIFAQPSPTETLWLQGAFLRAEWNY
jgi:hypothetical protein